jgi:ETFB lysine methyltransferase
MPPVRTRYQTLEFGVVDIHVETLRDDCEFSDDDGVAEALGISSATWPIFGILRPAGRVLAHLMAIHDVEGLRVLELGCGIGLSSLVLNQRGADITATDYHPEVGKFLSRNVALNGGREIPYVRTGWDDDESDLGLFDLIIGSDVLYEYEHCVSVSGFIHQHAGSGCEVIIVDPGRGEINRFSKEMEKFGYTLSGHTAEDLERLASLGDHDNPKAPFKGRILHYAR